ncbi:MAG: hypothetical protein AB7T37_07765 [Dehalococcoidia bacterium]
MNRLLLISALAALSLVAFACTGAEAKPAPSPSPTTPPGTASPPPTQPPSPSSEPSKPAPTTPAPQPGTRTPTPIPQTGGAPEGLWEHGKRTGNAKIDAVLDAWERGDVNALKALVQFQQLACVAKVEGAGGPPICPEGVPAGTLVKVMPASQCEGYYAYESGLTQLFQSFVDGMNGTRYYLYAAWESAGDANPPAGYRIQFARTVTDWDVFSPQVVMTVDGRIFMYRGGCNPAPMQVPAGADFILEPAA